MNILNSINKTVSKTCEYFIINRFIFSIFNNKSFGY